MTRATSDVGGSSMARGAVEQGDAGAMPPGGLEESWFRPRRPASNPPPRPSNPPPESLDDDVADAWFR
jgi:hypothetical protein